MQSYCSFPRASPFCWSCFLHVCTGAVYNHWAGLTGLDWWTGTVDSIKFSTHVCYGQSGQRVGGRTLSLTSRRNISMSYKNGVWWAQGVFDQDLQPRARGFLNRVRSFPVAYGTPNATKIRKSTSEFRKSIIVFTKSTSEFRKSIIVFTKSIIVFAKSIVVFAKSITEFNYRVCKIDLSCLQNRFVVFAKSIGTPNATKMAFTKFTRFETVTSSYWGEPERAPH